ncbi:MAG TPA: TonB-dependent receptor [Vicinamibacterales bacterium]|nr:TonB-dependent receptor [Vicinamibacterales bacterium]
MLVPALIALTATLATAGPVQRPAAPEPAARRPVLQTPPAQPPAAPQPKPEEQPPEVPRYEETVVVSASRTEERLVNAPATMTVISGQAIAASPTPQFGELLRAVPGLNLTQVSARDFNVTTRGATGTLATGLLALLDGRSIYLDFFGFVMWDFLPVNLDEIKRIEVIRGPASAVWGANALHGVVNVITKSPREMQGTSVALGIGAFGRAVPGADAGAGTLFYAHGTHAEAPSDRWAYKISAGVFTQDPLPRPVGVIDNAFRTPYPPYENQGTTQPKLDVRVDYDHPDGRQAWTFAGGIAGTDGIVHSGIGPFDVAAGSLLGYARAGYSRGAFRLAAFTNLLDGDAANLLARDASGRPIGFVFKTRTFDVEVGDARTVAGRHVLSYGGNFRFNAFDLSLAPQADSRTEGGAYLQDDIFLHERLRVVLGGRLDGFSNLDGPVFSPRTALLVKPAPAHTFRLSYNRAYRAPSVINEFLDVQIANRADLSAIHPLLRDFVFPVRAQGNPAIREQSLDAWEVGYTGVVRSRTTLTAAFYVNRIENDINFAQIGTYTSANPPPGWPAPLRPVLDLLNLRGTGLPCCFTYVNLGAYTQRGFELGVESSVHPSLALFANYSWQGEPDPSADVDRRELNLPPRHRVNAGFNVSHGRWFGNLAVAYTDRAFWQDVLDARYHGFTRAYTLVNGGLGARWRGDRLVTALKVVNLANEEVQQHIFGDILRRQVSAELRVAF